MYIYILENESKYEKDDKYCDKGLNELIER